MTAPNPFPTDALDANRRGELTDLQRRNLGAQSRYRRRNAITIALFLTAGAAIVWFLSRPDAPLLKKQMIAGGALTIAAFLVVRSITGSDALTEDVQNGRVEAVEGAVGKRRVGHGRARDSYYLEVGDRTFTIGSRTYALLPEAGWVRAYFLPRSRQVVNVEILPNRSIAAGTTVRDALQTLVPGLLSRGADGNEARAEAAAIADAFQRSAFDPSPQPPPAGARYPRPLAEAILGTWTNPMFRVTFSEGGTVVIRMFSGDRQGHWSVDATGRLRADIMGGGQTADAWIVGDRLTIAADGQGLVFTRERG